MGGTGRRRGGWPSSTRRIALDADERESVRKRGHDDAIRPRMLTGFLGDGGRADASLEPFHGTLAPEAGHRDPLAREPGLIL